MPMSAKSQGYSDYFKKHYDPYYDSKYERYPGDSTREFLRELDIISYEKGQKEAQKDKQWESSRLPNRSSDMLEDLHKSIQSSRITSPSGKKTFEYKVG